MHQKRNIDSGGLRRGKCLVPIHVRGNQAVAIHNDPLVRISGAIFPDPIHLAPSIARRNHFDGRILLKAVREAQYLLLLRRRQAANSVQNGCFEAHTIAFLIITEIASSNSMAARAGALRVQGVAPYFK